MKHSAVLVALLLVSCARAGISFIPHVGYPAPGYFSGTDARAFYEADVSSPDVHIQAAQLYVGGVLTIDETYPVQGRAPHWVYHNSQAFAIMFDANRFPTDTSLEIKMRAEAGGVWYESTYSAPAYNFCRAFGRNEWEIVTGEDGAKAVDEQLSGIGYTVSYIPDLGWNASLVHDLLDAYSTVVYFNTHGAIDRLQTDYDELNPDSPEMIYFDDSAGSPDFLTWRAATMGSGYSPFNSTAHPPINLCVFDSCLTGSTSNFATLLFPYLNAYTDTIEDQAIAGWTVSALVDDTRQLQTWLWEDLVSGDVIDDAIEDMITLAEAGSFQVLSGGSLRAIGDGDFRAYGDHLTRIFGVYTGDHSSAGWWRRL
jgi:hypothetical protein